MAGDQHHRSRSGRWIGSIRFRCHRRRPSPGGPGGDGHGPRAGDVDESAGRVPRSIEEPRRSFDVSFDLSAPSPSSVCRAFRRKLATTLFSHRLPMRDEMRAFASEIRRWCQYGNLSVHLAASPQFTLAPFRTTDEPRLSLVTEWALLRNDDPIEPKGTTFLFWVKTVSEGWQRFPDVVKVPRPISTRTEVDCGACSTRPSTAAGDLSHMTVSRRHGRRTPPFPRTGNVQAFLCDGPQGPELFGCPRRPRLRSLYPADSIDGVVTVSLAERFIVGGTAQAGISVGQHREGDAEHQFQP